MLPVDEPGRQEATGIDPNREAAALYFLIQGLIGPVLIGELTPDAALDIVDHELSRIFRPRAR